MTDVNAQFKRRSRDLPYRDGVGVVAVDGDGRVLVGKANGFEDIWKMCQGGIDAGEDAGDAALRELYEEFGIKEQKILRSSNQKYAYDYPEKSRYMQGFRGQEFKWFLVSIGDHALIDLMANNPENEQHEFEDYMWVSPQKAVELAHNIYGGDAVTYQRQQIYQRVFEEFGLWNPSVSPEYANTPD